MQIRFGELYSDSYPGALSKGFEQFAQSGSALPVAMQPNDQFTMLNQNLGRIASSLETLVGKRLT